MCKFTYSVSLFYKKQKAWWYCVCDKHFAGGNVIKLLLAYTRHNLIWNRLFVKMGAMFLFPLFLNYMNETSFKNYVVSRYLSEGLPELTLMLDIHYMVLPRRQISSLQSSREQIRLSSPK